MVTQVKTTEAKMDKEQKKRREILLKSHSLLSDSQVPRLKI
jgi:hypothetical protein